MDKLNELIEKFKNDKKWNTEYPNGKHRFDKEIEWIEHIIKDYAEYFKMSTDNVVEIMESNRSYSWPNYYQKYNFPEVSEFDDLVGIYKTFDEFHEYAKLNWKGFKCPVCKTIGTHPQECEHRIKKDKKCDWTAYGLIKSSTRVIILEDGFKTIPIFEPVLKTDKDKE